MSNETKMEAGLKDEVITARLERDEVVLTLSFPRDLVLDEDRTGGLADFVDDAADHLFLEILERLAEEAEKQQATLNEEEQ